MSGSGDGVATVRLPVVCGVMNDGIIPDGQISAPTLTMPGSDAAVREAREEKGNRHEYKTGTAVPVSKMKDTLVRAAPGPDPAGRAAMPAELVEAAERNVIPVMPGRPFEHRRKHEEPLPCRRKTTV